MGREKEETGHRKGKLSLILHGGRQGGCLSVIGKGGRDKQGILSCGTRYGSLIRGTQRMGYRVGRRSLIFLGSEPPGIVPILTYLD